jgi:PhnB protein
MIQAEEGKAMQVQPYLFLDGRCEEAIEFYRKALGAEVQMLLRFKECPDSEHRPSPGTEDKVMHSSLRIGEATVMMSDGRSQGKPSFAGFALSLPAPDVAEAERLFNVLADGGQVQQPLIETFFSPRFGMVADRFGVPWMVVVATPGA